MESSKCYLRNYVKKERMKIINKKEKEKIILNKIINHKLVKRYNNILLYVSLEDEVSTINLIKSLWKMGKNLYAPKIVDKDIHFYKFDTIEELKKSKYNILEPTKEEEYICSGNEIIIVPGLMFDIYNNRLGYGGGYYDRFLQEKNIYKIGVCFKEFLVNELKVEKYDVKMDEVICD